MQPIRHAATTLAGLSLAVSTLLLPSALVAATGKTYSWSLLNPLPYAVNGAAVTAGRDGAIYLFGGSTGSQTLNTTLIYHPRTMSWSTGPAMPLAEAGAAAVTLPDGRLMVMGGGLGCDNTWSCTIRNTVQVYDPKTHVWCLKAPMLHPRDAFAAVVGPDRRVYAIGGWDGQAVVSSVEAYNPRTDSWTTVPDLPLPLAQEGAVVTRHHIVVLGGGDAAGNHAYGTLFVFNGHGWVGGSSMPSPRRALGAAVDAHGMIFAIAGLDNSSSYQSAMYVYNPFTNYWSSGPSLPEALQSPGVVSSSGHIYAIGGWNGSALSQVAVLGQLGQRSKNPFANCTC